MGSCLSCTNASKVGYSLNTSVKKEFWQQIRELQIIIFSSPNTECYFLVHEEEKRCEVNLEAPELYPLYIYFTRHFAPTRNKTRTADYHYKDIAIHVRYLKHKGSPHCDPEVKEMDPTGKFVIGTNRLDQYLGPYIPENFTLNYHDDPVNVL